MNPFKANRYRRYLLPLALCLLLLAVYLWSRRGRPERLMDLPPGQFLTIHNGALFIKDALITGGDPIQFVRKPGHHGFLAIPNPNYKSYDRILRLPIGARTTSARPILQVNSIDYVSYVTETPDGIYYLQPVNAAAISMRRDPLLRSQTVVTHTSTSSIRSTPAESLEDFSFPTASAQLMRIPFTGGNPQELFTITRGYSGTSLNESLVIVGSMAYWIDLRSSRLVSKAKGKNWVLTQSFLRSRLMRRPLQGGGPCVMITGLGTQSQLIAGEDGVYCLTSQPGGSREVTLNYIGNADQQPRRVWILPNESTIQADFAMNAIVQSLREQNGRLYSLQVRSTLIPRSPGQLPELRITQTDLIQADVDGRNGQTLYTFKPNEGSLNLLKVYRGNLYFLQATSRQDKSTGKYRSYATLCRIRLDPRPRVETLCQLPPDVTSGNEFFEENYLYFTITEQRDTSRAILNVPVLYRYRLPE